MQIPRLHLNLQGKLEFIEEDLILDLGGWSLNNCPAELTPAEFAIHDNSEHSDLISMKRPFIIGIGGTCSNAGKTTTAVMLLRHLTSAGSGQQAMGKGGEGPDELSALTGPKLAGLGKWGAIKYTKTEFYASLIDDKETLSRKDKDTGRFIEAGAGEVVWVKSPPEGLEDILLLALERLSSLDGIVVEGNSAIEFLQPDIVIFIFGNEKERWKPGIERLAGISDIIIYENESELPGLEN
jgi:molybdopterin-guanine dinucleotide biosynthesis protein